MSAKRPKRRADFKPPGQPARERRQRERRRTVTPDLLEAPDVQRPAAVKVPRGVRPMFRLPDGTIGYGMVGGRPDECLRTAIATATQIHIDQVPDLRLDARVAAGEDPEQVSADSWQRLAEWADRRGLELYYHETVPVLDRERWIGVVKMGQKHPNPALQRLIDDMYADAGLDDDSHFQDHCLVMRGEEIIFDPAVTMPAPEGMRLRSWRAEQVTYGLTFDPKEE